MKTKCVSCPFYKISIILPPFDKILIYLFIFIIIIIFIFTLLCTELQKFCPYTSSESGLLRR